MRKGDIPIEFVPEGSRLTFIKRVSILKCLYKCVCGKEKEINCGNVKSGKVKDCGCYEKEFGTKNVTHGLSKHPLFFVWVDMRTRCLNANSTMYCYYGAIGVKICKEWMEGFQSFYDWAINNGWEKGLRLDKDKIPRSLGIPAKLYSPEMCCFLTHKENCNSRSSNHQITFNGITKNITVWERELEFPKDLVYSRLKKGWSVEDTLTITPRQRYKWIEHDGIRLIQKDWAKKIGLAPSTLAYHLKKHSFDKIYNWFVNGNNYSHGWLR